MEKKKKLNITKNTKLKELFKVYPNLKTLFLKENMDCLRCMGLKQETIRHAAENHGIMLEVLLDKIKNEIEK